MPRRLAGLRVPVICVMLGLGLAACGSTLNMNSVTKAVADDLAIQLSLPIDFVTCPEEPRKVKAGDAFECIAKPRDGGIFTVKVTQADNKGHVTWELVKIQGIINMRATEQLVTRGLKAQAGVDATVSCVGKFRPARAGDIFECRARIPGQGDATIVVTVKDDQGLVNWSVKQ